MKTITEQLHEKINLIERKLNEDDYAVFEFIIQDKRVIRFNKKMSINFDDVKPEITD